MRTLLQRAYETQQHENSYWHEQIMGGYQSRSYQTVRRLLSFRSGSSRGDVLRNPGQMLQHCHAGSSMVFVRRRKCQQNPH